MLPMNLPGICRLFGRTLPKPRASILVQLLANGLVLSAISLLYTTQGHKRTGRDDVTLRTLEEIRTVNSDRAVDLVGFLEKRHSLTNLLIIDARSGPEYEMGHIPGALNVFANSYLQLSPEAKRAIMNAPEAVVYCSRNSCDLSRLVRAQLVADHYTNVFIYPAGFEEWSACGLEIANQKSP